MSMRSTAACMGPTRIVDIDDYFPNVPVRDQRIRQEKLAEPFIGHFKKVDVLGGGGYGSVYEAEVDTPQQGNVALKLPNEVPWPVPEGDVAVRLSVPGDATLKVMTSESAIEGLHREALILQTLFEGPYAARRFPAGTPYNTRTSEYMQTIGMEVQQMRKHPGYRHIHRILDFNQEIPCIVGKLHEFTLGHYQVMNECGLTEADDGSGYCVQPEPEYWKRICKQLCQAVEYVHWMGYIHCDIKPANILCDQPWKTMNISLHLADFGLCIPIIDKPHYMGGTGGYRAPETSTRPRRITESIDHYAVVMTLLEILDHHTFPCATHKLADNARKLRDKVRDSDTVVCALCDVAMFGVYDIAHREALYKKFLDVIEVKADLPPFAPTPDERNARLRVKRSR